MTTKKVIAVAEDNTVYEFEFDKTINKSEDYLKETLAAEVGTGVVFTKIYDGNKYHICQYCGEVTLGTDKDKLCEDCRMTFGHSFFSEL